MEVTSDKDDAALQLQTSRNAQNLLASGPSALLLTTAPIVTLQEELHDISNMGLYYTAVGRVLFTGLRRDKNADRLRQAFLPFLRKMAFCTQRMDEGFHAARFFYSNEIDDYIPGDTADHEINIGILADPKNQARILAHANTVISRTETSSRYLQAAIPLLPVAVKELAVFVDDYTHRESITLEREKSILSAIFYGVRDQLIGRTDPTTLPASEIASIQGDLALASSYMAKMGQFLDRWRTHFLRLRQTAESPDALASLGYTTVEDYKRLYNDRKECIEIICDMQEDWDKIDKGFIYSSPAFGPH